MQGQIPPVHVRLNPTIWLAQQRYRNGPPSPYGVVTLRYRSSVNVPLLIDAIVRNTTALLAQIATSGGMRAPLAQIAEQVFLELASELERQGVSRKVSADMFGLALRTYLRRIQRLTESQTDRGQTLWQAVYDFISRESPVRRDRVLERFRHDEEASVRGVLRDLIDNSLVRSTRRDEIDFLELDTPSGSDEDEGFLDMLWVHVYRNGPVSVAELREWGFDRTGHLEGSIAKLQGQGRIRAQAASIEAGGAPKFVADELLIPHGKTAGWEAAVLDHYQAVVHTVVSRLRSLEHPSAANAIQGGSTYTFVVAEGHPYEGEVNALLSDYRKRASELREKVLSYNREHGTPTSPRRILAYAGQCVDEDGATKE